jgi:Zn-dependent peptidase ImmA (M78 family)
MPYQIEVEAGTILIDSTLTEHWNRGRENFTVMHEVFHQVLHKKCFRGMPRNYVHPTSSRTIDGRIRYASYALAMIEKQANACAAAFLMPAELVRETYQSIYRNAGSERYQCYFEYKTTLDMAKEFSVSEQAMSIRLQTLGLIKNDKEN